MTRSEEEKRRNDRNNANDGGTNEMKTTGRMVLAVAGMAAVLWGTGCASPGEYCYVERCVFAQPNARTLANGPYYLSFSGRATLVLWGTDMGQYLTDEMREKVAEWLEMPREEVNIAHFAWWLHRACVAAYGSEYDAKLFDGRLFPGKCFITSTPYTDSQRQLFNWITWHREELYRGENRKKLRFAYFKLYRDMDGVSRTPEGTVPPDAEYWVCIFDKDGNPLATASTVTLTHARVAELHVPGKAKKEVRVGDETLTMWSPNRYQESDAAVVRGLLVEALNAMDEEQLARLEVED